MAAAGAAFPLEKAASQGVAGLRERLKLPAGPVQIVLDTDTYNEVDDQFALAYALLSPEAMTVEAVYAAPFTNSRSSGPADGMERSYQEIHRILDVLGAGAGPKYANVDRDKFVLPWLGPLHRDDRQAGRESGGARPDSPGAPAA